MTAQEVIGALAGWLDNGESFEPVETVETAVALLKRAPTRTLTFMQVESLRLAIRGGEEWLKNEEPHVDDSLIRALLHWVRYAAGEKTT